MRGIGLSDGVQVQTVMGGGDAGEGIRDVAFSLQQSQQGQGQGTIDTHATGIDVLRLAPPLFSSFHDVLEDDFYYILRIISLPEGVS